MANGNTNVHVVSMYSTGHNRLGWERQRCFIYLWWWCGERFLQKTWSQSYSACSPGLYL